jgi:hypothetical protein
MSVRTTDPRRTLRRASALLVVPLALGLAACSGAAAAPRAATGDGAPTGNAANAPAGAGAPALGAPAAVPAAAVGAARPGGTSAGGMATTGGPAAGISGSGVSGAAVASGTAIAFPYPGYPGSPGLAPDHMIVVTGTGRATEKADLSDQPQAREKALAAALDDARAQADIVAKALGITIAGVSSVSVSSGETYAVPMMGAVEGPTPAATPGSAPDVAPGAVSGSSGGTSVTPPQATVPSPAQVPAPEVAVSVTVAYRIG